MGTAEERPSKALDDGGASSSSSGNTSDPTKGDASDVTNTDDAGDGSSPTKPTLPCDHATCLYFEDGTASSLAPFAGACSVSDARAKDGKGALLCQDASVTFQRALGTKVVAFDAYIEGPTTTNKTFPFASLRLFKDGGPNEVTVTVQGRFQNGTLEIEAAFDSDLLSNPTKVKTVAKPNEWHHYELSWPRANGKLKVNLKVDSSTPIDIDVSDPSSKLGLESVELAGAQAPFGAYFDNVTFD